jgi:Mn2+/Fe2+ NRAMP family transporter
MQCSANALRRVWHALGPGLVTGAADDDPSGIATYSQAGAQFGFALSWTMLLTLPFMAAIQIISACIGWETSAGLARNIKRELPAVVLYALVALVAVANTINIAADLAAMGESLRLVIGGPAVLYAILFGLGCLIAEVLIPYHRYAGYLKLLTLVLLAYVAAAFSVHISWGAVLTFCPHSDPLARSRVSAHDRCHLRHHDQPLPVLLAGLAGSRGVAAQPSRATLAGSFARAFLQAYLR